MPVYYNEFDHYAANWLRRLIAAGKLPAGEVDERDIHHVSPDDLKGYNQCHFFAGIGGWPLALSMAGWPDDRPVWTGSPPCQPFSLAGFQKSFSDPRDLWPQWLRLVREREPFVLFGEQVAGMPAWLDRMSSDLEAIYYTVGAAILPACAVDADHKRERLWFVANRKSKQVGSAGQSWKCGDVEHSASERCNERRPEPVLRRRRSAVAGPSGTSSPWPVAHTTGRIDEPSSAQCHERRFQGPPGGVFEWISCGDGRQRRIKPGVPLLANGIPGRVGKVRGFGNAIDPRIAATFVSAAIKTMTET